MADRTRGEVRYLLFDSPSGVPADDSVVSATVGEVLDAVMALLAERDTTNRQLIRERDEARCSADSVEALIGKAHDRLAAEVAGERAPEGPTPP